MSKHITKLSIRDTLRISAVDIEPSGRFITIAGKNRAGKSCTINSIALGLGGRKAMEKNAKVTKPIRDGAERAEVVIETEDLRVRRVFTASGERVTVESKLQEGAVFTKPQTTLDKLFNAVTFEPLKFANAEGPKQTEMVQQLMGLDFADLDAQHKRVYDERSEVNRKGRDLKGVVAKMPHHEDAPAEEVSAAELVAELKAREKAAYANRQKREELERAEHAVRGNAMAFDEVTERIEELEAHLETARASLAETIASGERATTKLEELTTTVGMLTDPDLDEVKTQIAESESVNRKVRANQRRASEAGKVAKLRDESDALTLALNQVRAEREKRIAAAEFPVPGLDFGEDGVVLNGIPFSQSSHAEQIRVSVAVGIAANPELRVFLIRDGSTLDEDSLALLAELAEEHDCQIWLEDARSQDPAAIVIEDGHIQGVEPAEGATA